LGGRRCVLRSAARGGAVKGTRPAEFAQASAARTGGRPSGRSQPMCVDGPQVGSDWDPWSSIPPEFNLGEALTRAGRGRSGRKGGDSQGERGAREPVVVVLGTGRGLDPPGIVARGAGRAARRPRVPAPAEHPGVLSRRAGSREAGWRIHSLEYPVPGERGCVPAEGFRGRGGDHDRRAPGRGRRASSLHSPSSIRIAQRMPSTRCVR
jgi:hypothetical protein